MPKETLHYTNGEMTVVWKPKVCIHSTLCWKGLIEVFNPKVRPWIKMDGATTEKIIEQVRRCPSRALSFFLNSEVPDEPNKVVAESATMLKVVVTSNGTLSHKIRMFDSIQRWKRRNKNQYCGLMQVWFITKQTILRWQS